MNSKFYVFLIPIFALGSSVASAVDCNAKKEVQSKEYFDQCMNSTEGDVSETNASETSNPNVLSSKQKGDSRSLNKNPYINSSPVPTHVAAKAEIKTISLELLFEYNSANLTTVAKQQLEGFAQALTDQKNAGKHLTIEGHTDGIGGDAYNRELSERRAAAVKNYLVDQFKVDVSKIKIEGKGKAGLANPENPTSDENRRVVFYIQQG